MQQRERVTAGMVERALHAWYPEGQPQGGWSAQDRRDMRTALEADDAETALDAWAGPPTVGDRHWWEDIEHMERTREAARQKPGYES